MAKNKATYRPEIFSVSDMKSAQEVILTKTDGISTEERWNLESPYLIDLIKKSIFPRGVLIDYGCGIGRIAAGLTDQCKVLGVDTSSQMRSLAAQATPTASFSSVSRTVLEAIGISGFRADCAIAVWCLQHAARPVEDVDLLRGVLKPGASLFVVNLHRRAVPTIEQGWTDDGIDIRELLRTRFDEVAAGDLDAAYVGERTAEHAFWAIYR